MEYITQSLHRAIRKDTKWKILILFPICYFASLALGTQFDLPAKGNILGVILGIAVSVIFAKACLSSKRMEKILQKCFCDPADRLAFQENIQGQLEHSETKHYSDIGVGLEMWVTPDWFILISTNIRLICPHSKIQKINKSAIQNDGTHRMDIVFTDGKDCSSEYSCLYNQLENWKYAKLG